MCWYHWPLIFGLAFQYQIKNIRKKNGQKQLLSPNPQRWPWIADTTLHASMCSEWGYEEEWKVRMCFQVSLTLKTMWRVSCSFACPKRHEQSITLALKVFGIVHTSSIEFAIMFVVVVGFFFLMLHLIKPVGKIPLAFSLSWNSISHALELQWVRSDNYVHAQ